MKTYTMTKADRRTNTAVASSRNVSPTPVRRASRQTDPRHPPLGRQAFLALQRTVGNRATSALLPQSPQPHPLAIDPQPRPLQDPHKEHQADQIASQITRQLAGTKVLGTLDLSNPGTVPKPLERLMRRYTTTSRIQQVAINTTPAARNAADRMGAFAYANGTQIAFGSSARKLSHRQQIHLVTHELAHATLHPSSSLRGQPLVHAKLDGTYKAATAMGGEPQPAKRRFLPKLLQSHSNWRAAMDNLNRYENLERQFFAQGEPNAKPAAQAKTAMIALLRRIITNLEDWKKANEYESKHEALNSTSVDEMRKFLDGNEAEPKLSADRQDGKSNRHQAVAMLLPRLHNELKSMTEGTQPTNSPYNLVDTGEQASGQKHELKEITYQDAGGQHKQGYFSEETATAQMVQEHELDVGLPSIDPNAGGRSMALYKLDQLLNAGVTAKVEFAVHNGKLGTVMEQAQGKQPKELKWKLGNTQGKPDDRLRADDPILQKCLNRLQILDAIAGQLDRHAGNYFVQHDSQSGNVTGVTGIDLDMSFGKKMKDPSLLAAPRKAQYYRGVPSQFDKDMGDKILSIQDSQVRNALAGLLSEAEITATISRFHHVKTAIEKANKEGTLVSTWNSATYAKSMPENLENFDFEYEHSSYTSVVTKGIMSESLDKVKKQSAQLIREKIAPQFFTSLSESQKSSVAQTIQTTLLNETRKLLAQAQLPSDNVPDFIQKIFDLLHNDNKWWQQHPNPSDNDISVKLRQLSAVSWKQVKLSAPPPRPNKPVPPLPNSSSKPVLSWPTKPLPATPQSRANRQLPPLPATPNSRSKPGLP
jgi:hypothetical protein